MLTIKTIKKIICVVFIMVLILLVLLILKDNKYSPVGQLTYEEKLQDSKYLIEVLEKTYPYFKEDKELTGDDFLQNKNKYMNLISKTNNDEEFLITIKDILDHLHIGYGKIAALNNIMGENYYKDVDFVPTSTREYEDLYKKLNYWREIYENKVGAEEVEKENFSNRTSGQYMKFLKKNNISFINVLERENAVLFNFSAIENYQGQWKYELEKTINTLGNYKYMILDLRESDAISGFQEVLSLIVNSSVEYSLYNVFTKNKYNDNYLAFTKGHEYVNYKTIFEKYPETIKRKFITDKFNVYKNWQIKGKDSEGYRNNIIVLTDEGSIPMENIILLDVVKKNNLGIIIGKDNMVSSSFFNEDFFLFILPNSKLPILVNNSKLVDSWGNSFATKIITPDILVKFKEEDDNKNHQDNKGDIERYSYEDIIFNKCLEYMINN